MLKQRLEAHYGVKLYNFIRQNKIKTIVETGIAHGLSSYFFLNAVGKNGLVISIEPKLVETVEKYTHPNWIIIVNKSGNVLESVLKAFKPDMFFHDSLHIYEQMKWEYETALPYCKYIISHDINHNTAWKEFIKNKSIKLLYTSKKLGIAMNVKTK